MTECRAAMGQDAAVDDEGVTDLAARVRELEAEVARLTLALTEERQHALVDALTDLPNRRAYERRLAEEIARAERSGEPLSLLVWDIDHFKRINDRHGHATGDRVLGCVGDKLGSGLRQGDFSARLGGEEFVSLLPDCGAADAVALADRLRLDIARGCFGGPMQGEVVTISCGIATFVSGETDPEALFDHADTALYQAKSGGRNKVCLA